MQALGLVYKGLQHICRVLQYKNNNIFDRITLMPK